MRYAGRNMDNVSLLNRMLFASGYGRSSEFARFLSMWFDQAAARYQSSRSRCNDKNIRFFFVHFGRSSRLPMRQHRIVIPILFQRLRTERSLFMRQFIGYALDL